MKIIDRSVRRKLMPVLRVPYGAIMLRRPVLVRLYLRLRFVYDKFKLFTTRKEIYKMRLTIVTLKLSTLNYAALESLASTCVTNMTGSLLYPSPNPNLADFTLDLDALRGAIAAWGPVGNRGSHASLMALRDARAQVRKNLTQWAFYAENATPGNYTALSSVGWPLRPFNSPVGPLPASAELVEANLSTSLPGDTRMRWKLVKGAVSYNVYTAASPTDPFVLVGSTSATVFVAHSAPGRLGYFMVRALGAAGEGVPCYSAGMHSKF